MRESMQDNLFFYAKKKKINKNKKKKKINFLLEFNFFPFIFVLINLFFTLRLYIKIYI